MVRVFRYLVVQLPQRRVEFHNLTVRHSKIPADKPPSPFFGMKHLIGIDLYKLPSALFHQLRYNGNIIEVVQLYLESQGIAHMLYIEPGLLLFYLWTVCLVDDLLLVFMGPL